MRSRSRPVRPTWLFAAVLAAGPMAACQRSGAVGVSSEFRLTPVLSLVDGAPVVALRGAVGSPCEDTRVDPCFVRVHGEQFTPTLVEREGQLLVPLGALPRHDVVVGLSTVTCASEDGFASEHHKAIVAAGGADGEPVPTTAVTARLGLRGELTPLLDPCVLGAGDTLPVRLALDHADPADVRLLVSYAASPDGAPEVVELRTRAQGFADIAIRGAGEYLIRATATLGRLDGMPERAAITLAFVAGGRR